MGGSEDWGWTAAWKVLPVGTWKGGIPGHGAKNSQKDRRETGQPKEVRMRDRGVSHEGPHPGLRKMRAQGDARVYSGSWINL